MALCRILWQCTAKLTFVDVRSISTIPFVMNYAVRSPAARIAGRRQNDVRQQLVVGEYVFLQNVLRRRHGEVLRRGHFAFSSRSENTEASAVCNERNREVGRVHNVAWTVVAENRVILILARRR